MKDSSLVGLESSLAARTNALWFGFASLLLLMLFTAAHATQAMRRLEVASARTRSESIERNQLLEELRTDIYHASTVLRDYLVEDEDTKALGHRQELERVRARIKAGLSEYQGKLPERERVAFGSLRADVAAYGKSLEPPLAWSPKERAKRSDEYLQVQVIPQRREAVDLVKQIELLNEREVESAERELITAHAGVRQRIMFISTVTVLLGAAIAVLSIRRIHRLEREAERRYEQVKQARQQLSDLSGRLVNAQEEERRSLSRELHDQLGQTTAALVAELARLERDQEAGSAKRERITAARHLAEENVKSIRDISLLLRPSMLDDLGLLPALRWQAREVRRRSGLKVQVVATEFGEELPDPVKTCIYRVVQEALNNCVKHAEASDVRVVLRCDDYVLSVVIQDNGSGFDPIREKGVGILGMEERVQRLGGSFEVHSQVGQGTALSASFPAEVRRNG